MVRLAGILIRHRDSAGEPGVRGKGIRINVRPDATYDGAVVVRVQINVGRRRLPRDDALPRDIENCSAIVVELTVRGREHERAKLKLDFITHLQGAASSVMGEVKRPVGET